MIPISDQNPTLRFPVMTVLLLVALGAIWLWVQGAGLDPTMLAASVCRFGLIPAEITGRGTIGTSVPLGGGIACGINPDAPSLITVVSHMFMHGGWGHILGNGLFLWVFGNNVEDSMGRLRFVLFYVLCGLGGAAAQMAVNPASPVPMVGASGAIAGVLGAYLVLYPRVRVNVLFIFFFIIRIIPLPAYFMLLWWIGLQLLSGLPQLTAVRSVSSGVAFWAHIGGFATGVALVKLFENRSLVAERVSMARRFVRGPW